MTTPTITTVNLTTEGQPAVVPLPSGALACASCGVAVPAPARVVEQIETGRGWVVDKSAPDGHRQVVEHIDFARCALCTLTRERAEQILAAHPRVRAGIGGHDVALYRLSNALHALDALRSFSRVSDLTWHTDAAVRALLTHLAPLGGGSWAARREAGTCASTRWAHLGDEQRDRLSAGLAAMLKARNDAARAHEIVKVAPPEDAALRGCLMCGVRAVDVMRSEQDEVWSAHSPNPRALGGTPSPSAERLDGYLCPSCEHSVEQTGGVLGATAMEHALLTFLGYPRHVLSATELVGLRAWAVAAPKRPNATPWEHMDLLRIRDELGG